MVERFSMELPWPPSVNRYWRSMRGRVFISAEGTRYRREVIGVVLETGNRKRITGRIKMSVSLYPPDKRRRDIDNILKALLDALQHAGVYDDDNQIKRLEVDMTDTLNGTVMVDIEEIPDERTEK